MKVKWKRLATATGGFSELPASSFFNSDVKFLYLKRARSWRLLSTLLADSPVGFLLLHFLSPYFENASHQTPTTHGSL